VLRPVTSQNLKDGHNWLIWTVVAQPASEQDQEDMARAAKADENRLLKAIEHDPKASLAVLAGVCGWRARNGEADKVKAQRRFKSLEKAKLIIRERDEVVLTDKGKKTLRLIAEMERSEAGTVSKGGDTASANFDAEIAF
jgi:hypothetical protein